MTIATDGGGHRRTPTDDLSQARDAAALAVRVCTWLRDEEANVRGLTVKRRNRMSLRSQCSDQAKVPE